MIHTRTELNEYIQMDNEMYFKKSLRERIVDKIASYPEYKIMQFKRSLRRAEYAFNTAGNSRLKWIIALFYERKKNRLGRELGIDIDINCFGKGLQIFHGGSIVVNPRARIGENCKLHGGNCIGNNGKSQEVPMIGNNVDIGYGACVTGNIVLADNIVIGSNAAVVKSCIRDGAVLAGVPAKEIR